MRKIFGLWAAALISAVPASAAPPAAVQHIPAATFAALPLIQKPVLSPDGHHIAAQSVADEKTKLVILDADHPEAAARAFPVGKPNIVEMRWAGNNRLLLQLRLTEKVDGTDIRFFRLIAIDIETGVFRLLDKDSRGLLAGDILYVDPTGSWALVSSQTDIYSYPSVKRVDLSTGVAKQIESARQGIWSWHADENGVVRAGISYDGPRYTIWYRDTATQKLREIHGKFKRDDDSTVDRLIFRGGQALVLTNAQTGRFGLYEYDVKTGAIGNAVFEHPEVDVDSVLYNPVTGKVSAAQYQDDRSRLYWLDPTMKDLQVRLDAAIPRAVNLPIGFSVDGQRTLVSSSSADDPGRYFLLDGTTNQMHPVAESYPDIDPEQLASVKAIRYQARDGLVLRGYLTLPRGRQAQNLPLIVLPHGGPFYRDEWGYDATVQLLANRGYAVLQPEFRGSTGFGKDFVAKGYGEIGKKMQDDLDDGVDWLVKSGQVDPKRVCIVGMSYGGYAALWGAIRNPERYRCAASWAGPSDMPAMMHYDTNQFSAPRYFRVWRKRFPTDAELDAVSPVNFADRMKVPVLIGQGEKDETVPPKQSHKMVDALTKAGANVTSVFYKDSGHNFENSKDLADWFEHLEAFLAKYNPA